MLAAPDGTPGHSAMDRRGGRADSGSGPGLARRSRARHVGRRLPRRPTAPASDLALLAADTHLRYTRGQLPLEVGSERPEVVSRWSSGRVPFHLTLPDYPGGPGRAQALPSARRPPRLVPRRLRGVRRVPDGRAADLAARDVGASSRAPRAARPSRSARSSFHQQSVNGLKVITWTDKGLTYALASDLSVNGVAVLHGLPRLARGAPEVRRALEPDLRRRR